MARNLAYVRMPVRVLEDFFNTGMAETEPRHGLRNIKIERVEYIKQDKDLLLLISSPDVPAYVALAKAKLEPLRVSEGIPIIKLTFECIERTGIEEKPL